MIWAPWSVDQPPIVTIAVSPAVARSSMITIALVAFDAGLSRFGWTMTVSAKVPEAYALERRGAAVARPRTRVRRASHDPVRRHRHPGAAPYNRGDPRMWRNW